MFCGEGGIGFDGGLIGLDGWFVVFKIWKIKLGCW